MEPSWRTWTLLRPASAVTPATTCAMFPLEHSGPGIRLCARAILDHSASVFAGKKENDGKKRTREHKK